MFTKYRIVKVRFSDSDKDYFAYEMTFLGIFKSYLNVDTGFDTWFNGLTKDRDWLYTASIDKIKNNLHKIHKPKIDVTITNAETKLERHLGGIE